MSKDIYSSIRTRTTIDTALDTLITLTFPAHKRYGFTKQLKQISQNNFFLIEDYIDEISILVHKWCATTSAKKGEADRKVEEIFFDGLAFETIMEMERHNITTYQDIVSKIKSTETVLLQFQEQRN